MEAKTHEGREEREAEMMESLSSLFEQIQDQHSTAADRMPDNITEEMRALLTPEQLSALMIRPDPAVVIAAGTTINALADEMHTRINELVLPYRLSTLPARTGRTRATAAGPVKNPITQDWYDDHKMELVQRGIKFNEAERRLVAPSGRTARDAGQGSRLIREEPIIGS